MARVAGILPICFLFLIPLQGTVRAQEPGEPSERVGLIRGRVLDAETLLPLPGVVVTAVKLDQAHTSMAASEADGSYTIPNLPVGTYTLRAETLGYGVRQANDVVVRSRRITFADLSLRGIPIELEGLVNEGGFFQPAQEEPSTPTSYSGEEIRRAPGSAGDVSRVFMTLPSVAKVSDQSNGLAVRGGNPSESGFYLDNIEIPNINHFPTQGSSSGPIGLLNTDLIQNATFHTGGFSSRFGDRLSSVMDIRLREGNREEFDGQMDLNFAGFGAVVEGPMAGGNGSYLFSLRRSYLDLIVDAVGTDSDVVPEYSDATLKLSWDLNQKHKLVALGIMGLDDITSNYNAAIENDLDIYGGQQVQEGAVGMDWRAVWNGSFLSNTSVSFLTSNFEDNFLETPTQLALVDKDASESAVSFRNQNQLRFGNSSTLRFGADVKLLKSDFQIHMSEYTGVGGQTIPELNTSEAETTTQAGAFVSLMARPLPRLTATLGLRSDYFEYTDNLSVSPRASLTYQATDRTALNLSGGIFRQNLPMILLSQNEDNRDLKQPWATHLVAGVEHLLTPETRLTVEGYVKEYRDFPMDPAEPQHFTTDEAVYRFGFFFNHPDMVSTGKARARGIEVLLQKKLARDFYGLAAGSFSQSEYRGLDGEWRDRVFDNRWMASLEGGYKPSEKWEFSLRWIYAGGAPYTPVDVELSAAAGRTVLDESRVNAVRYPDYHSLNLRFDRRFYFQGSNLVWYVSVWNAYNRKNVAAYYWNELKGEVERTNQWGLLPIFGLEYEF